MKVKSLKLKVQSFKILLYLLLFTIHCSLFTVSGCGYQLIGSRTMPFGSVTIHPVMNKTYEPRLEDRLHSAFSMEFIAQGINVKHSGGDIGLETAVTAFELSAFAAIGDKVQEQEITMKVDIKITEKGKITELKSIQSPIKITFQSAGTLTNTGVEKEKAIEKACTEIAREIISKIIIMYAK